MITKIVFNNNIRKLFKKGEVFELHPLTTLVGDNGSGKSTFLKTIVDYIQHPENKIFNIENSGPKLDSYMFMDFEKNNPRMQNGNSGSSFTVFSQFRSHGETNMDIICNHFSEFKSKLVLLDEPDQALSIRSIYRMKSVFDKMLKNGCQIIVAVHSETLMRIVGNVLSLEHHKWMDSSEFLETQKKPKRMRTVDKFQENVYYAVKFIKEDGSETFLPDNDVIDRFMSYRSIAYAKRFKKKKLLRNMLKKKCKNTINSSINCLILSRNL